MSVRMTREHTRGRTAGRTAALTVAAVLAGLLVTVPLWSAAGATGGWTLTASPTSVSLGVPTDIALTATNIKGGATVGCVEVQPTPEWTVNSVRIDSVTSGLHWTANAVSAGTNLVIVHAVTEADVLKLDKTDRVVFTINATGTAIGTYIWPASSRDHADCSAGIDAASLSMSVVGTAPVPTPPTPFPVASPSATASSGATEAPSAKPTTHATSGPSVTPALSPPTSPSASQPDTTQSPSGAVTPHPAASSSPSPSDDPFVVPGAGNEGGGGDGFSVDPGSMWFGNGVVWIVPGIALTVPGLLLVLIVIAQALGGAIWLPLARRRIGEFGIPHRGHAS